MSRYDYEELKNKALSTEATQEDINALGEWFEQYGYRYWNGECFVIDEDYDLYPILAKNTDESVEDCYDTIGYEIRR